MPTWPDTRILDLLGIELPIIQAPMAGANGAEMVVGACETGGLGSLPCAMLTPDKIRAGIGVIRQQTAKPFNLNFFCHTPAAPAPERDAAWKARLAGYYTELGLDPAPDAPAVNRAPFDETACEIVEDFKPAVVSFHFGLPAPDLLARVKATGCKVLSSATTVNEARWLERQGCDAIIAQGTEAGGHRGMFLNNNIAGQAGLFALLPQIVDAVSLPVIAAGGIGDGRGIAAAFMLGAAGVQIGTAYLFTPEATISDLHREALMEARDDATALTNLFSGRPARGLMNRVMREIGPINDAAPPFPTAGGALAPLKAKAEAAGSSDFSSLWSGQAASLSQAGLSQTSLAQASLSHGSAQPVSAQELTRKLAEDAMSRLKDVASRK